MSPQLCPRFSRPDSAAEAAVTLPKSGDNYADTGGYRGTPTVRARGQLVAAAYKLLRIAKLLPAWQAAWSGAFGGGRKVRAQLELRLLFTSLLAVVEVE
jgi:hypothetical protein